MLTNQKKRRGKSKHRSGSMSMDLTFNIFYINPYLKKENAGSLEEQIEIDTFNMKKENVIGIGIVSDYLN